MSTDPCLCAVRQMRLCLSVGVWNNLKAFEKMQTQPEGHVPVWGGRRERCFSVLSLQVPQE